MIWHRETKNSPQLKLLILKLLTLLGLCVVILPSCTKEKVPLRYNTETIEIVAAHWYETENVAYFFFRIKNAGGSDKNALLEWSTQNSNQPMALDQMKPLNLSEGVHLHSLIPCNQDLCGSFSFFAKQSPNLLKLRLKYHANSPFYAESIEYFQDHLKDRGSFSMSALAYGVFDDRNEHIKLRIESNFGNPTMEEFPLYGMKRKYRSSGFQMMSWNRDQILHFATFAQSPTLFPSQPCDEIARVGEHLPISGQATVAEPGGWINVSLGKDPTKSGVCFLVDGLTKSGHILFSSHGLGRRNPVTRQENYVLKTPIQPANNIPVILQYCNLESNTPTLHSELFLNYQKFIIGFGDSPTDLCFQVGKEESFREALKGILQRKLQNARIAHAAERHDFIFAVVMNHRLNSEFLAFQQIVAEELNAIVATEFFKISPRLAGAFVYDSNAYFENSHLTKNNIIWCPQDLSIESKKSSETYDRGINCLIDDGKLFKSALLNFLIPMGPFPSLATYESYYNQYGDKGFTKAPRLEIRSVPINEHSLLDFSSLTTFFEAQTLNFAPGESLRICLEKPEVAQLFDLKFKATSSIASPMDVGSLALAINSGSGSGDYLIGVNWNYPFIGNLHYDLPVNGSILGVIPFQKSLKSQRAIGDAIWNRRKWQIGPLMQKCVRFCDYPYFDEAGVYQIRSNWNETHSPCLLPKIPAYPEVQ